MKNVQTSSGQRGVSLIELMVGLAIGLLVITVAMSALMVSRGISGSVSDSSSIQQQGAYVLRVIGQQLRQNGSLFLNPDPTGGASTDVLSAVAFEVRADARSGGNSFEQHNTLVGGADTVTTGFRRYRDNVFLADNAANADNTRTPPTLSVTGTDFQARNCVGGPGNAKTDERVESIFTFANGNLLCGGNGTAAQPIAQNVAQFQVTYLTQTTDVTGVKLQYKNGSDMPAFAADPAWRQVQGVQVCLVLFGSELIDMPTGSNYIDCNGDSVNVTTLNGQRQNRMHLLFRNTFQLRSQGLL